MSFIKVTDPRKREELIKDFIQTRKRIKDNFIAQKVGEADYQTGLTKLFKPVTETQKATAKEITEAQKATAEKFTSELLPIREGIEELPTKADISNIPTRVFNQIFPALKYKESDITNLGAIAVNSLIEAFTKDGIDRTHGIYAKDKKFYMGNKPLTIKDNDISINTDDGTVYNTAGTPGLWRLITEKNIPDKSEFTPIDLNNYIILMFYTKTIYKGNEPTRGLKGGTSNKLKFIKYFVKLIEENKFDEYKKELYSYFNKEDEDEDETNNGEDIEKYEEYLKEFFDDPQPGTSGTGLKFLSSDPNALIDRFDLLFSSKKAGHTGVRNEIISILDELKRQGVIKTNEYKKLNSLIKK